MGWSRRSAAVPTIILLLAGCQMATPNQSTTETTVVPHATGGATAANTGEPGIGAANGNGTSAGATGTSSSTTSGSNQATGNASSSNGQAVNGNQAVDVTPNVNVVTDPNARLIKASSGGVLASADGTVTATIPPGALDKDAQVAVTPLATSSLDITNYVPGIRYHLDLGGALMTPDSTIKVVAKVDPRFVDTQKARDPNFSPDKYSLSQNADGTWSMTMTIHGPATKVPQTPTSLPDLNTITLDEFGNLALPGGVIPKPTLPTHFALLDTGSSGVPTPAPTPTLDPDSQTWVDTIGPPVPCSRDTWYSREGRDWDCGAMDGISWFMNVYYRAMAGNCQNVSPPPPPTPTAVNAHVKFVSDDPAVDGKDASGVDVRFSFVWTPQNGPADVVTDGTGLAHSWTLPGGTAMITPYMSLGPTTGSTASVQVSAGMPTVETTLPKYSPQIILNLKSDSPLPDHITLTYSLAGSIKTQDVPTPAGTQSAKVSFYVRVPGDDQYDFQLDSVTGGELGAVPPLPTFPKIQRTHQYAANLGMMFLSPK